MAERVPVSIDAGSRILHKVDWALENGRGRDGSLDWSVMVHGSDLTIDLEVSAKLSKPKPLPGATSGSNGSEESDGNSDVPTLILLHEVTRGRSFRGLFDPAEDSRLAIPGSTQRMQVDAIIFDFSNIFSWWTGKEIDIILLRTRSELPEAEVAPLPCMQPHTAIPSRSAASNSGDSTVVVKEPPLRTGPAPSLACVAPLAADASKELARLKATMKLHAWLSAAQKLTPALAPPSESDAATSGQWCSDFNAQAEELRQYCRGVLSGSSAACSAADSSRRAAVPDVPGVAVN
eukprot:TRINITY_DN75774_c0_g1_i1.p1 TRINITY_DN75774_c0_g1~~TRINITY_DN75774_c0_g1_i1.p1  ORF type:complete len:291 (-),score=69.93 TRINITY_DN75774_c0_g1_i1:47-919(-)